MYQIEVENARYNIELIQNLFLQNILTLYKNSIKYIREREKDFSNLSQRECQFTWQVCVRAASSNLYMRIIS